MQIPMVLVVLALLCQAGFAFPVRITGRILDRDTRLPVPDVSVSIRTIPITRTDGMGVFRHEADLDMDFPVQLALEAPGYASTQAVKVVASDSLDFGDILMEALREKKFSFCGTVRDSLTMEPMARIRMRFQRNLGDPAAFLTADTDSLGGFCLQIPLSNNPDGRAFWSINATDYYPKSGEVLASDEAAPLTIRLQRIGSILIEVRGRAIDSATSQPLSGVMVVLGTNYLHAKPDTSFTGEDGRFRRMVQGGVSSSSSPRLYCILQVGSYKQHSRSIEILAVPAEYDFGQISLVHSSASLGPGLLRPFPTIHANSIRFDANGRRMTSGPAGNRFSKPMKQGSAKK